MRCLIAGSGSDIAAGLHGRLLADGWEVQGTSGRSMLVPLENWDLLILAHGQLAPIDKFFECNAQEWLGSMMVNAIYPLSCLRSAWPQRNAGATVIFLGGPNMQSASPTYTAYRAGKAILESIVETLGVEYPDIKFRVLHPGIVKTKIHEQTLAAGHKAANYDRVMKFMNGGEPTVRHEEVYLKLKALIC